jgi:hypothetical protein
MTELPGAVAALPTLRFELPGGCRALFTTRADGREGLAAGRQAGVAWLS